MQDRKIFWANNWSPAPTKKTLFLDYPYVKGVRLSEEDFRAIKDQVFEILYFSLNDEARKTLSSPNNHKGILEQLNATSSFAVNVTGQLDSFVELEKLIIDSFDRIGFTNNFVSIQFPIDVRVVHPVPPLKYLDRPDAVDFLHCDAWRGEPADVVNCVLYCEVSDQTSQLLVYDISMDEIDLFTTYTGPEKDAGFLVENIKPVEFVHEPGQAIFFDAYTPHQTKRNGDKIRISLNFSFRRTNPYKVLDERWDRPRQPWSKYWYIPSNKSFDFRSRFDNEMNRLGESGQIQAQSWRKNTVEKMLNAKIPEVNYAG